MDEQLQLCADQLQAALPDSGNFAAGGLLTTIQQLIAAVRAGDVRQSFILVVDLLVMARDAMEGDGDVINFGASPLAGMDWGKLLSILGTILSLLAKK